MWDETTLCVALCGALLLSSVLGAGDGGFSDVPSRAWYAEDADYCARLGLMNGTGGGRFSPDGAVTVGELMTVCARLHAHFNGGGWDLPKAPDPWGTGTIYGKSGVKLFSFTNNSLDQGVLKWGFHLEGFTLSLAVDERSALALTPAGDEGARAELELNGVRLPGGSLAPAPGGDGVAPAILLEMPVSEELREAVFAFQTAAGPEVWCRDALYYLEQQGLRSLAGPWSYQNQPDLEATRLDVAGWLRAVLPEEALSPINQVDSLPDATAPDVLDLYRAGILSGSDGSGSFQGGRGLTRKELCAVVSRAVDPERRVAFTLDTPDYKDYSLTKLDTAGYRYQSPMERAWATGGWATPYSLQFTHIVDPSTQKYGYMDIHGKVVAEPVYDSVAEFCADGTAAVQKNGLWGYIDTAGREVVPCRYGWVQTDHDGVLLGLTGEPLSWERADTFRADGTALGSFPMEGVQFYSGFSEGLCAFSRLDGERDLLERGYLDPTGEVALAVTQVSLFDFSQGLAAVQDWESDISFLRPDGTPAFSTPYLPGFSERPFRFHDGLTVMRDENGRHGAIDTQGRVAIPFRYDWLEPFSDGMAVYVKEGGSSGYVDRAGRELPLDYALFQPFSGGYAAVSAAGSGMGYIDKTGRQVTPLEFSYAGPVVDGRAVVETDEGLFVLSF